MFKAKIDVLSTIIIVSLVGLALFQVRELAVKKFGVSAAPASQAVTVVERAPEARPEAPPRVAGKSGHRFAQRASATEATD